MTTQVSFNTKSLQEKHFEIENAYMTSSVGQLPPSI